jgi:serine protease inhibitor ecotin
MRNFMVLPLLALAACSSAGAKEEEKYHMVERQPGDVGMYRYKTLCAQSKAVASAYLDDQNEAKYREWKQKSDLNCSLANDPFAR